MSKQQLITGIVFVLVGLYVSIYSFVKLDIGTFSAPGSGFFTLICGSGILLLSLIWLISGLKKASDEIALWEKRAWIKPLLAIALIALYAILIEWLGYVLSTAIFIVIWQILISQSRPRTIIIFVIVGTGGMYFLFGQLLSVPLPYGVLGL